MIQSINLVRNLGTFDSDSASATLRFKRLNLIYADNGRGKTTLAAMFRSLSTADPQPIIERKRLSASHPPHIVLKHQDQSSTLQFQHGRWNRTLPGLKVFDDVFVNNNVHSGLAVEPLHRQNLHELILGDQGVALNSSLQELMSRITKHNSALEEKGQAIPQNARRGLSLDEFCDLPELLDIDDKIRESEHALRIAEDQEAVGNFPLFDPIGLPDFDIDAIRQTLSTSLSEIDSAAETQVNAHLQLLGKGGESWIEVGFKRVESRESETCPFCGQSLDGSTLVSHYRAFFSQGYDQLKQNVVTLIDDLSVAHSGDVHIEFERAIGSTRDRRRFWTTYTRIPAIDVDSATIFRDWVAARESVLRLLKTKQAAPLDLIELDEQSIKNLESYHSHSKVIKELNEELASSNEKIRNVQKQAESTNIGDARRNLARLKATRARFSQELSLLCEEYMQEKKAKACAEAKRAETRKDLEEYRENVFPEIQDGVNEYLEQFNAAFQVDSLKPMNIGAGKGSSCTYNVVVNDTPIPIMNTKTSEEGPSFRNSLSAGDRNTLALALFFSSLDKNPELESTIVVIDDPVSSLDDQRSLATIQAIRDLSKRAEQVIVMSHSKSFLCKLWDGISNSDCLSLEIALSSGESTLRSWNVSQDAITEHDKRHQILQQYFNHQSGNERRVAEVIRPHMEGYLRVICPDHFGPGALIGQFLSKCRDKVGTSNEILEADVIQEIQHITEYGNQFHHDTNKAWQTNTIVPGELRGYVRRTLKITGP